MLTLLLAFVCLSCGGSGSEEGTRPSDGAISLSATELLLTAQAQTAQVKVTAERGEWTAYSSADWAKVANEGTASRQGTVTITVTENRGTAAREALVTVKSGSARATITVKQNVPLTLSTAEVRTGSRGEKVDVSVTAGEDWTVSTLDSWIKAEKTGDKTFAVTTQANEQEQARTGSVLVKTASQQVVLSVYQESVADRTMKIPAGYSLAWHDEFDGTELSSDWTYEVKPARWVNNEEQEYVRDRRTVEVKDGSLNIHCFKDTDGRIKSGRIYARQTKGWQYGYFEARMLLPKGKGTWPAFWMMPVNFRAWPADGEIDIMEEVGVVPNEVSSSIHCTSYNHNKGTQKTHAMTISKAEGEYHVYALEWTKDYIKTYVDGNPQLTFMNDGKGNKDTWPFDAPFYVIFNLAWGGMWGGMQGVDYSALPVTMQVDYVRVFQK